MSSSRADRRAPGAAAATAFLLAGLLLAAATPLPAAAQSGTDTIIISPLAPPGGGSEGDDPAAGAADVTLDGAKVTAEEASAGPLISSPGSGQAGVQATPSAPQGILPLNAPTAGESGSGAAGGVFTPTGAGSAPGTLGTLPTQLQVEGTADGGAVRYQPQGDAEGMGVLGPNEGGFGRRVWAGTDRRVIEALLPRLPANNPSSVLYDLARRLLLTDAVMPAAALASKGLPASDLMAVRLDRLAALGETEGLARLLQVLPEGSQPELRRRLEVELLLTRGRESDACQSVRAGAPEDGEDRFWLKALTYCQILSGERAAAELGLTILRESARSDDQLFLRLAEAALGLHPLNPGEISRLEPERIRPLEFALLSSIGLPLPPKLILEGAPRARLQLIHDVTADLDDRTQAAEWAVATRRLPAGDLALLYGAYSFTAGQIDGALTEGYGMQGVEARALYFQSIGQQDQPDTEIRAAELALERAEADGVYSATARVVLPALSVGPDDVTYAWFADTAGRALYVLGRYEEATAWLLLARQEAAISARAAVAAHRLWPYSRLAGIAAISNEAGLEGWRYAQPDPNGPKVAQQLSLLRVLFDALGESDAMAWIDLAMSDDERAQALPDASLLYALEDASYSGRLGETVLLALIVMGETPPAEAHPLALNAVLSALMQVGLPIEARALAIEAALGSGI